MSLNFLHFQHLTLCPHNFSDYHLDQFWTVFRSDQGGSPVGECLAGTGDKEGRLHVPGYVCFPFLLACARDGEVSCDWIGRRRCLTSPPPPMASNFSLRPRGLRGCVTSPSSRCLYLQILVKGCACDQNSLSPLQRLDRVVLHREKGLPYSALFARVCLSS